MSRPRRRAPKPGKSDLPVTHIACNACDDTQPVPVSLEGWECSWCGCTDPDQVIFEHHSPSPLGFIGDKNHRWDMPGRRSPVWIYNAQDPREGTA